MPFESISVINILPKPSCGSAYRNCSGEVSDCRDSDDRGVGAGTGACASMARRVRSHYGLIKMCLPHLQDAYCSCALDTYTAVPWAHIQPCPAHIYNCALDTFYKRVFNTFKCVFTLYIYREKIKNIDTFRALLPNFHTIVQRKYVRILAIAFAVGIEPTTLGPMLYHYTTSPKEFYS